MVEVEIPDNKEEIKKQIRTLESLLVTDSKKVNLLHKEILKPNTTYFYRVGDASLGLWRQGTFQTASKSGAFSFVDLADPQAKDYGEGLLAASTEVYYSYDLNQLNELKSFLLIYEDGSTNQRAVGLPS